jgi:hypothetical protein
MLFLQEGIKMRSQFSKFKLVTIGILLLLSACGRDDKNSRFESKNPSDTVVTGTGDEGPTPSQIAEQVSGSEKGLWGGLPITVFGAEVIGVDISFQIGVETNRLTNYVKCKFPDGSELSVQASAPVEMANGKLKVLKTSQRSVKSRDRSCSAEVKQSTVDYSYERVTDHLSFFDPKGKKFQLSRVKL